MKIYTAFTAELDSTGARISEKLSEVDLSNPEDVKALIPDGSADILVHFGDTDFLGRYQRFQDHLHEWLTDHPKLASVDMRYERQVVLEMQPGASTSSAASSPASSPAKASSGLIAAKSALKSASKADASAPKKPVVKTPGKPPATPVQAVRAVPLKAKPALAETWHMVVVKPHTKEAAALTAKSRSAPPAHAQAAPQ